MQLWLAARRETSPDVGMTDAIAPAAADSAPSISARLDDSDPPWPLRPWIMAAICAVAGLAFHLLIDHHYDDALAHWRSALAAGIAAATVVFVLGVERRRWHWALGFALIWGAILGLIAGSGERRGGEEGGDTGGTV